MSERTISSRRVEVRSPAAGTVSATVTATAPRVLTLHERFSQLPKVEPKKEEKIELNVFQEAGVQSRRQATEIRQIVQRNEVVSSKRAVPTTWTPSFDDDDTNSSAHVSVNLDSEDVRIGAGGRRQFELASAPRREPAFVVKGIPPAKGPAKQRAVLVQQTSTRTTQRFAAPSRGGHAPRGVVTTQQQVTVRSARGTRQVGNPFNNGSRPAPRQAQPVSGGRGGGVARSGQRGPVAPAAQRGGRGGVRGGRGGARGGATEGAKKPLSKDALDADLDSYMLQTPASAKNYLDQQLDDYMRSREKEASA